MSRVYKFSDNHNCIYIWQYEEGLECMLDEENEKGVQCFSGSQQEHTLVDVHKEVIHDREETKNQQQKMKRMAGTK